jgi:hypothetical protein
MSVGTQAALILHIPSLDVRVDTLGLTFDIDNSLILLFNQHGHLREHLRELGKGLFDLLDLGVSFLDFTVCASSSTISVRVEKLSISFGSAGKTGSLQLGRRLEGYHFP